MHATLAPRGKAAGVAPHARSDDPAAKAALPEEDKEAYMTAMTAVHALWRLSRARVRETTCGRGCWAGTTLAAASRRLLCVFQLPGPAAHQVHPQEPYF